MAAIAMENSVQYTLTFLELGEMQPKFERSVAEVLRRAMACPPDPLDWPVDGVESPWSATTLGTVRYLNRKSKECGGGWIVIYDPRFHQVLGYSHAAIADEELIEDFHLADDALPLKAIPGDLVLTFSGTIPELHGSRLDLSSGAIITPPDEGYPTGTKRPGTGIYRHLWDMRMHKFYRPGMQCWVRTRPGTTTVIKMAESLGFSQLATVYSMANGAPRARLVLGREAGHETA